MQLTAVDKHFSVAMACSVVGHLVLLFLLLWYLGQGMRFSDTSWVLDLTLSVDYTDAAVITQAAENQATARQPPLGPPSPAAPDRRTVPNASAAQTDPPRPTGRPAARGSEFAKIFSAPGEPRVAPSVALDPEASGKTAAVHQRNPESASIIRTRAVAARSAPETNPPAVRETREQALLPQQKNMLERKLRKWAEKFHKTEGLVNYADWQHKGQRYTAEFRRQPAASEMDLEHVTVEIRTQQDGTQLTTRMHMKKLSFSHYAQFVDRWDTRVQIHDDELDGRFHSNSSILLAYDRQVTPTFHGKVTTASRQVKFMDTRGYSRRDEIFRGGLETGVRRISLPGRFVPFGDETVLEKKQTQVFEQDTHITFYPDGSYGWRQSGEPVPEQRRRLPREPMYLVGGPRTTLLLAGVVAGKVLVYSPERIIIAGNLTYAISPTVQADAENILGLVSDKYVEIAAPEVTGPGDLHIHAAIHAGRRFAVRDYSARERAKLYLLGSLSAGTVSATEPRYATVIQYDRRLENLRPPGFPVTDRYELTEWDGRWTATNMTAQN